MASEPVAVETSKETVTVDVGEIPFGPTEDADKSTKERHERNLKLIAENQAEKVTINPKYKDETLNKTFKATATIVQYKSLKAFVNAYGEADALKLANSAADLRQRSGISAVLKAKAEGPEKALASGIKSLGKAGINMSEVIEALKLIDPSKAALLEKLQNA